LESISRDRVAAERDSRRRVLRVVFGVSRNRFFGETPENCTRDSPSRLLKNSPFAWFGDRSGDVF